MLEGDMNTPRTFVRIIYDLFADYIRKFRCVDFNDILIYSDTEHNHLKHIVSQSIILSVIYHNFSVKVIAYYYSVINGVFLLALGVHLLECSYP